MRDAFIFDALRTPRGKGKADGALYEIKPIDLLSHSLQALRKRQSLDTSQVDDLILGCVTPISDQGANIAKAALLYAGWAEKVPGIQINRFCASGLEALNMAAMKIRAGWGDLIVAGGLESMSRVPMESDRGPLLFDPDVMLDVRYIPQGVAADLIATMEGYSRETLDAYALRSHQRAAYAWEQDYFQPSIVPIYDKNGLLILDRDEHVRPDTSAEQLAALTPSFQEIGDLGFDAMALQKYPQVEKIHHLHTAGNTSGVVDGAALLLIGSEEKGAALGLKPRARILAAATVGSDPTIMLQGNSVACEKAMAMAGMTAKDIDLWEMNEVFASPVLQLQKKFGIDDDHLNVNGGAISLGHPLGATGSILMGTLLDELERRNLNTGLVTMCVGAGMGVATIIERV